jgi:Na+-transporting methylmalonyl-CoA/oxaloacetate decarboxylase gamma subunit
MIDNKELHGYQITADMKFVIFLAFLLFGIWFVGLIIRSTFSRWLRRRTEEYNRAAKEAQREARSRGRREGEVRVEATRATVEKKVNRGVGEYVEFEEITIMEEDKDPAK